MTCTQIVEAADPDTWNDNYLCAPRALGLEWSSAGPIPGKSCTAFNEPSDPHSWGDNFLCWTAAAPPPVTPPPPASKPDRFVTVMYSTWADYFSGHRRPNGAPYLMADGPPYGADGAYNWWGTPAFGNGVADYHMMIGNDPERPNNALIDYHADLLHNAGVDFISIDLTNGEQDLIVKGAMAVAKRYSERPAGTTPKIVLFARAPESAAFLYQTFYSGHYRSDIFFRYEGKPLILLGQAGSPIPTGGALDRFTARHTWGLTQNGSIWSFKQNTSPAGVRGPVFYNNGVAEEMSVAAACQATYMTDPDGRKGRRNGDYFAEQWGYVMEKMPKFVFVTAWNEWGSQNFGDATNPVFVDTFGTEYSADLEPMRGGHGDQYYRLLTRYIREYKSR